MNRFTLSHVPRTWQARAALAVLFDHVAEATELFTATGPSGASPLHALATHLHAHYADFSISIHLPFGAPMEEWAVALCRDHQCHICQDSHCVERRRLEKLPHQDTDPIVVLRPAALLLSSTPIRRMVQRVVADGADLVTIAEVPSSCAYAIRRGLFAQLLALPPLSLHLPVHEVVQRFSNVREASGESPLKLAQVSAGPLATFAGHLPSLFSSVSTKRIATLLSQPEHERLRKASEEQRQQEATARKAIRRIVRPAGLRKRRGLAAKVRALVVIAGAGLSGAQRAWLEVARFLPPELVGFLVGPSEDVVYELRRLGFRVYIAPQQLSPVSARDARAFYEAIQHWDPTVVHFDGGEGSFWAPPAFALGKAIVQHLRVNDIDRFRPALVYADTVVTVSRSLASAVESLTGEDQRVEAIPDGLDLHHWQADACARYGSDQPDASSSGNILVLCPGRIEPSKRQDWALEVVAAMRPLRSAEVLFVGPCGTDAAFVDSLNDRLRGTANLWAKWLSPVKDMRPFYAAADVVLVPSKNEALGMVGIETLAMGSMLAAFRSSGYAEIIRDGVEGLLFDEASGPQEWASRIDATMKDVSLLQEMRRQARRRALAEFDGRITAQRLTAIWDTLPSPARLVTERDKEHVDR